METSGKVPVLRCRKCRKCVVDASCLLTMNTVDDVAAECKIWHMDFDNLPAWILASIHQACWTSGRLSCQHCGARLGGFNFLSQPRCPCGRDLSVHLSRSRLDQDYRRSEFTSGVRHERGASAGCPSEEAPGRPRPQWLRPWRQSPASLMLGRSSRLHCPRAPEGCAEQLTGSPAPDYCGGGRAGTGLTGSFSDSPQTRPLAEAPPHQPRPSAAGQQEEGPETTHLQEVPTPRRRRPSLTSTDEGEEPQEGAEQTTPLRSLLLDRPVPPPRLSRRERNRLKSQRRKERRRERWVQKCLHQHTQRLMGSVASSENEDEDAGAGSAGSEGLTCAVCLDVFFSPHVCQPCGHVFCEPCLRTLAKNRPTSTPCPLCRTLITHTLFQRELSEMTKTFFPKLYLVRKQNFLKSGCSRWPLPSSRKLFHIFSGLRGQSSSAVWRLLPHGGFGLGGVDVASLGWRSEHLLLSICSVDGLIILVLGLALFSLLFLSY